MMPTIRERFRAVLNRLPSFKAREQYYPSGQEWLRDLIARGGAGYGDFLKDIYSDRVSIKSWRK